MAGGSSRPFAEKLHALAQGVLGRAHAPYSSLRVAAALLTADGSVVTAVNVENASLGLSMCAERAAVFRAVAEGHMSFVALALAAERETLTPCGACRQVLAEFADEMTVIYPVRGELINRKLSELLPERFGFD